MSSCKRFEKEGLLILQKGGQLHEHFSTCQTCIDARQKYESLEKLIATADSTAIPADGWQERVLESVNKPSPSRKGYWSTGLAAGFAAIMFTGVLLNQYAKTSRPTNELEIMLVSSGQTFRGAEAKIGDTMEVAAYPGKSKFLQIRVYRDGHLFDACGLQTPCQLTGNVATQTTTLSSLGQYETLLIRSDSEVEFTANRLDPDVVLADDRAALVTVGSAITVR